MNKRKFEENVIDLSQLIKQAKFLHDKPTRKKGTVKFDLMTSLQNIVMVRIVNNLWMTQAIKQEKVKVYRKVITPVLKVSSDEWDEVVNNIVAKISRLPLPHFLFTKLIYIVPAVGKSILQWIGHHDKHILNTTGYSECSFVDLISNITWTARGKIDYALTARNILANPDICLNEDTKFKLACTFCLENEIILLSHNVAKEDYLNSIDIEMHPMVGFWTTHITGNYNMSDNESILWMLINNYDSTDTTFSEVAITYVWNKLTAEEKAQNITSLIKELENLDLKYTLLSNLEYEQQEGIFKECSYSILVGILKDWSWEEYFLPTTLHFLDVMEPSDFVKLLKKVTKRIINNSQKENKFMHDQYKSIFKELWQKCSRNFKDFVFEHENGCGVRDFLIALSCKQNMDIISLILNDLNIQQKKNVIFGFHGIECCFHLIQNDMWDVLELLIDPSLFSEDDIILFKQAFVTQEGHGIAAHFLQQNALDKIEYFMSWAFKSLKDIDQFRKSLSHVAICEATLDSIITHNGTDFTELENHFNWCAQGDLKVINEFKARVPMSLHFQLLTKHLIINDSYDLLEKVLNWCFVYDKQKIVQFKSNMYKNNYLASCIRIITIKLIKKDDSFTMLERFLGWCFTDEQEIKEFKTRLLNPPLEDINSVCSKLLGACDFELADKFLNWCITSSEEVSIYKNTLMLSRNAIYWIINWGNVYKQNDLQLLFKWFNASKVTLQKFHSLFLEEDVPKLQFYELVREIIENLLILKDNEASTL